MKKILFVLPGIMGGGAERVVLNLYKALETHKGHECHILSLSRNIAHAVDPDIRVHYLDEVSKTSKKGINRLTYRKKNIKIIDDYIENTFGNDCFVLSNMMFADKIMSLSRHKVYHIIHSAYTQSLLGGKAFYRRFFIKRNINNIYRNHPLIFVSTGALNSFCENFTTKTNKHVIYNPVNDWEIQKLAAEQAEVDFDYILHVGRFNRAKRHDRLIKAYSMIKSDIKLLLLGEGRLEGSIRSQIDALGLSERVLIMGFKTNPYPYISGAKVLVLCSDFEGLPTVIIEAISLGTPFVATDCPGGIREIVDRNSPSLVPLNSIERLANAIDDALADPGKYKSSLDDKFMSQHVATQYDNLFDQ